MEYRQTDIPEFIQDNDVKFVKFSFCDVFGRQKIVSVLPSLLPKAFEEGVAVDASRVDGFYRPFDSEVFLFPDTSTAALLPWRPSHGRVARFYCEVRQEDGSPFELDSRRLLKKAVEYAEELGISVSFGAENDFYLFRTDNEGEPTDIPFDRAGYMDEAPEDRGEDVRRDICLTLEDMGISPLCSQHISGPGQNRIEFEPGRPLNCADNVVTFRSVVKMMASRNGLWATFTPKPIHEQAGSGFRVAMRPKKNGESCADAFLAGILSHVRDMTVFFNPTDESYERLGRSGAPWDLSWADSGRACLLRRKKNGRIEISSPDGMANPYLVFALLIYAGADGVRKKSELAPTPPVGERELLPQSLHEARKLCRQSEFLHSFLPEELIKVYAGERN